MRAAGPKPAMRACGHVVRLRGTSESKLVAQIGDFLRLW